MRHAVWSRFGIPMAAALLTVAATSTGGPPFTFGTCPQQTGT